MYESYWGLSQTPFRNVPDPTFFCPLPAHEEALGRLLYAVQYGKGGVVLTGEPGCGKSTLSRVSLLELAEDKYEVGLIINPALPADEFLQEVALQLNLPAAGSSRVALLRALSAHLLANADEGRTTVLIVDEAHLIKDEAVFEDLRMLLNLQANDHHLLSFVLIGLPILRTMIERIEAFSQRMAFCLSLEPPNEAETAQYIDFRLKKAGATRPIFTAEALREIYKQTGGILRKVNKLCDICLYEGKRRKVREVGAGLVSAAVALT
jgi:general secretion pathway protein A